MPTQKESIIYSLANEPDIFIPTISPALKDNPAISKKSREKTGGLVDKMNHCQNPFARNLRSQKTNAIGVIAGKWTSNFMITAITGIENVANSKSYYLLINQSSEAFEKEEVSIKAMFNNRVDDLLVSLAFDTGTPDHFNPFPDKLIFYNPGNFINKQVTIPAVTF